MNIKHVDLLLLEAPIDNPIRTSFAIMRNRPALLVRIEDKDGVFGWGEIWCNHPPVSGQARLKLAAEVVVPMFLTAKYEAPQDVRPTLERLTRILNIQCAEPGPYAQIIAGLETAMWDLAARTAGQPLYRFLGGEPTHKVRAYASGINPGDVNKQIPIARAVGYRDFKIKIGFDKTRDIDVVKQVADMLVEGEAYMLDANQAWTCDAAVDFCDSLPDLKPRWLEEPLPADTTPDDWSVLAGSANVALAAGENALGDEQFDILIDTRALSFVQPDVAKWGGISGCLSVGQKVKNSGLTYCPHFLGAAPGLFASAHILAAVGGDGLLEVDINPNPLRETLALEPIDIQDGYYQLPAGDGIGFIPDSDIMKRYLVEKLQIRNDQHP